ncbi:class I SAM-dependent methyltransferase [Paludibaculum fermentans]|uniref:class I SAM-dependent methyltransferase n=1 Tax=Paludibaculum fermentans TaxID=1473598 RepID=UPI003EB7E9B5
MFSNAEAYEQFMGRWSRLVAPKLVGFSELPERGRVLDVGSGTGSLSFAVADRSAKAQVDGIDPPKEYVAYASQRNRFPDRVRFQVGDAQALQMPDRQFDAAVSLLVFNFLPDANKALLEVRRVTKPGGRISAAVWDYADGMKMLRLFWEAAVAVDPGAEQHTEKSMKLCRQGELASLWKQSGLVGVREEPLEITTRFQSFADYWDAFLLGQGTAGAYAVRLTNEQKQALRSELKRRLALPAEGTPFSLPARVWAVRGDVPKEG